MLTIHIFNKFLTHIKLNNTTITWDIIHTELSRDTFFTNYYFPKNINKIKGSIFEYIIKYILLKEGHERVYLFDEIPYDLRIKFNMSKKDQGIDILYYNKFIEKYIGVQCKWRTKQTEAIHKNDISGFHAELNRTTIIYGILATNVKKITTYHTKNKQINWIIKNTLTDIINNDFIDFMISNNKLSDIHYVNQSPIILRNYQIEAINKLLTDNSNRKQVIMACGTGKTIIMSEYIKHKLPDVQNILVLMPSLCLVSSFYKKNMACKLKNTKIICICSQLDNNALNCGENTTYDMVSEFIKLDKNIIYTTSKEEIDAIFSNNNKVICISTYQSSSLVNNHKFDICLFDEAHKTVNNGHYANALYDKNCEIKERIFLTATPKIYKTIKDNNICISMDNENIYGKQIYNYSFGKAIEDKNIVDFRLVVYVIPTNLYKQINDKFVYINDMNIKSHMFLSAIQLSKHIINNKECTKILTYHNSISNSEKFRKTLIYVLDILNVKNIKIFQMDGKTRISERNEILNEFENAEIAILCSARVLNEGIDLPCVDTVVFCDPRTSFIDIIQCIGRGMRLYKNKEVCNVIIPISYDQLTQSTNFSETIKLFTTIKEIDGQIVDCYVNRKNIPSNKFRIKLFNCNEVLNYGELFNSNTINININNVVNELNIKMIESSYLKSDIGMSMLFKYVNQTNTIPPINTEYEGVFIGKWFYNQLKKINSINDDICIKLCKNSIISEYIKKLLSSKEQEKIIDNISISIKGTDIVLICNNCKQTFSKKGIAEHINGNFCNLQKHNEIIMYHQQDFIKSITDKNVDNNLYSVPNIETISDQTKPESHKIKLTDFLKKYSITPHKFIDVFCGIYDKKYKDTNIVITVDNNNKIEFPLKIF